MVAMSNTLVDDQAIHDVIDYMLPYKELEVSDQKNSEDEAHELWRRSFGS